MKLNSKGFTLVEVLAVVVIMSIIIAIMVPNINYLIEEQKDNSLNSIVKSINSATKIYLSDNKYDIEVDGNCSNASIKSIKVKKENEIIDSKITVSKLIELGNLKTKNNNIKNPKTDKLLIKDNSYAVIMYDCQKKDLVIDEVKLNWEE